MNATKRCPECRLPWSYRHVQGKYYRALHVCPKTEMTFEAIFTAAEGTSDEDLRKLADMAIVRIIETAVPVAP